MTCRRCAATVDEETVLCPECGHRLREAEAGGEPEGRLSGGLGCAMLAALLLIVSLVLLFGLIAGGLLG